MNLIDYISKGKFEEALLESLKETYFSNPEYQNPEYITNLIKNLPRNMHIVLTKFLNEVNYDYSRKINDEPLFFLMQNFLNDEDFSYCLTNKTSANLRENNNKNKVYNLLIESFKNNKKETIRTLKSEFWLIRDLDIHKSFDNNLKTISDELYDIVKQNTSLIKEYSEITYSDYNNSVVKVFNDLLEEPEKNHKILEECLKENINEVCDETKERLIALTFKNTKNTKLTKLALGLIGFTNLKDYKPKTVQIWTYIDEHKDDKIFEKFIKRGYSPLSYNQLNNQCFITPIIWAYRNGKIEESTYEYCIDKIRETIFKEVKGQPGVTNFSLLATTNDSDISKMLMGDKTIWEKAENSVNGSTRLEQLNLLMEKTFFSKIHEKEEESLNKYLNGRRNLFSIMLSNESRAQEVNKYIEEHLEQLIKSEDSRYSKEYAEIINGIINTYTYRMIEDRTPISNFLIKATNYSINENVDLFKDILTKLEDKEKNRFIEDPTEFTINMKRNIEEKVLQKELFSNNKKQKTGIKI